MKHITSIITKNDLNKINIQEINENYANIIKDSKVNMQDRDISEAFKEKLNGPDAVIDFLRNLTEKSLMDAMISGLKFDDIIDVKLKADNKVLFSSTLLNIAARYNLTETMQLLLQFGADINQTDTNGNNALDYSASSYDNDASIYLFLKGCHPNDSEMLTDLLKMDDSVERLILFLIYLENYPYLLTAAQELHNKKIDTIIDGCVPYESNCFLVLENYIKLKTPDWQQEFDNFRTMFTMIQNTMEEINTIQKPDARNLQEAITELAMKLNQLTKQINDVQYMFSEKKQRFVDFLPFCKNSLKKIEEALEILDNNGEIDVAKYVKACEVEPFIHAAFYCSKNGKILECKEKLRSLQNTIENNINEIPDYEQMFKDKKEILSEIGKEFSGFTAIHLNSLVSYIRSFIPELLFNQTFTDFLQNQITGQQNQRKIINFDTTEIDIAIANLRVAVLRSQWKYPSFSSNSNQKPINYQKLVEYEELCEKSEELKQQLRSFEEFPSDCPICRKHVSSYICPFCSSFVSCHYCKNTVKQCMYCNKPIKDLIKINKTCYFGSDGNNN
ncbi:hypothetical protein TVAG_391490 [Trichomonas vaginalis G3]|uniref:Uncharacterized protein n=1 Tax=Trichomonas vaginalis (strain ATCC PRA-98 / G3) TaxID=412133 RepID=A2DFR2_TRIV3|nr:hypothetical protein TVAGG3_0323230 [Trichomonas vaginalis G3]EAY20765.1 hypothetical protein TVAG_391490 [Trichomonas vaginalis G3]KAI5529450.1 hypothetical protein TVAGG3_0323230 [Trichomonas vaginalis G3]|eukprot:XP_001581751.1 hypothetical protein [Trichomonas vaginalis G3]